MMLISQDYRVVTTISPTTTIIIIIIITPTSGCLGRWERLGDPCSEHLPFALVPTEVRRTVRCTTPTTRTHRQQT
jgi:hypothetical protein